MPQDAPTILQFPHPGIRREAERVTDSMFGTSGLRDYCQILANLLTSADAADVLTGTMVNLSPAWAVMAMSTSDTNAVSILVNPEIKDEKGNGVGFENVATFACTPCMLSAPRQLVVSYRKVDGSRREVLCRRSGARAVFTGVESLKGKIVLDRMSAFHAMQYVKRYREQLDERLAPALFLPPENIINP